MNIQTPRRLHRSGFTLIELLVVIAIIAILAAILFPVFAQAREKARTISCLSNTKEIGIAIQMYAQDYDETVVPWFQRTGKPSDNWRHDLNSWCQLLQPYIKNGAPVDPPVVAGGVKPTGMMSCPSFDATKRSQAAAAPDCDNDPLTAYYPALWYHAHFGIGFGAAAKCEAGCAAGTQADPYYYFAGSDVRVSIMSLAEINRPAETAIVTDGMTGVIAGFSFGTTMGCEAATAHNGGGNITWMDGHSKWIARNAERYLDKDANGIWYKRFFMVDR